MKKVEFFVFDELGKQIDDMVNKYGFRSRAEFLRFTAIDFIRKEGERIPSDDVFKEHSQVLRNIKTNRSKRFL